MYHRTITVFFLVVLLTVGIAYTISPLDYHAITPSGGYTMSESRELQFSTYIGGEDYDGINGMVTDTNGDIYIAGWTLSEDFPITEGAFSTSHNGGTEWAPYDAFVMKISSDGQEIIYSTFLGGSGDDFISDLVVDELGCAYVVGRTDSPDFPVVNAYDDSYNDDDDCFVTKLAANGSMLLFSTFVGGSGEDYPIKIAIDASHNYIIAGNTFSSDFPVNTTNIHPSCHSLGDDQDGFVFKLSADGSSLEYSMYLGMGTNDEARSVAVDAEGNAVIGGSTGAADFPTINALDDTLGGIWDCFVIKLNATGHFIFSTYFGGSGIEYTNAVSLDSDGYIYMTGVMKGGTFPIVGVHHQVLNGTWGNFLLIIDSLATEIIFSGVLRDSAADGFNSDFTNLQVVSEQEVWLGGYTKYPDFPTTEDAFDRDFDNRDGVIIMIDPVHSTLNYSSFFGGTWLDSISGLEVSASGDIIGAGCTESSNIPIRNALEPERIGLEDGFLFRFTMNESTTPTSSSTSISTSTPTTYEPVDILTIDIVSITVVSLVGAVVIVVLRRSRP